MHDKIIEVKVSWIKYKLWKKSPGFYDITRRGEWSRVVWEARSTFN